MVQALLRCSVVPESWEVLVWAALLFHAGSPSVGEGSRGWCPGLISRCHVTWKGTRWRRELSHTGLVVGTVPWGECLQSGWRSLELQTSTLCKGLEQPLPCTHERGPEGTFPGPLKSGWNEQVPVTMDGGCARDQPLSSCW